MTLRGISVGSLELTPSFSPSVTEYTVDWSSGEQTVTAEATYASDEVTVYADFEGEGQMDLEGPPPKTYTGMTDDLPVQIHVNVTDGSTTKRYLIRNTHFDE